MVSGKKCPKCGSSDVAHKDHEWEGVSERMKHHMGHQAAHALSGHPGMLLFTTGVWLAGKTIHKLRKPWQCRKCSHNFD